MNEILKNNNILLFLGVIFPPIFYAFIVWANTPRGSVKWKVAFLYFLMGILSTTFVLNLHWIFPKWDNDLSSNTDFSLFILCFLQVAIIEESMKFTAFKIANSYRNRRWIEHPAATMFYMMSVGLGFAFAENLIYVGSIGPEILAIRTFTALVMHMIVGLFMGYFLVRARFVDKSNETELSSRISPKIKVIFWNALAILVAASYHGLYDFAWSEMSNLNFNRNLELVIGIGLVLFGLFMALKLSKKIFRMS
jgi:RsiW-degrading membrane proteinase PrsW (M82 family)